VTSRRGKHNLAIFREH